MDLAARVTEVIEIDQEAPAVIFQGETWPWSYVRHLRQQLTELLEAEGIGQHTAIGVALRNRPASFATLLAVVSSARCLVTLSPLFSDAALAADVRGLGLDAVVAHAEEWARPGFAQAAEAAGCAAIAVSDDRDRPARLIRHRKGRAGQDGAGQDSTDRSDRAGIAIEMLSSGTTGTPKRIPLPLERLTAALRAAGTASTGRGLAARPGMIWNPLVHIAGMYFVLDSVCSGRPTVLLERFDVQRWTDAVQAYQLRLASLSPAAMRTMLDADIDPRRLSSLRAVRSGTAAMPPELQAAFEARFAVPVLTTYGATEFAGAVASWTMPEYQQFGKTKRGSSGRAHPGITLRTVDAETGEPTEPGTEGILEVSGGQVTAPGEWLRTTDLAVLDADGFLWIRGRTDDAIVRGGFKVHPAKVAQALEDHPAVREAEVVGLPDERLGEIPVAGVQLTSSGSATAGELRDWCKTRLAKYEVPAEIVILDSLPRTPSLKVDRPALRKIGSAARLTRSNKVT